MLDSSQQGELAFEERVAEILHRKHRKRWRALTIWIIAFSMVVIGLGLANRHRINDIKRSQVSSCKQSFEGTRQLFKPFFPPKAHRTPKQKSDLKKFNKRIKKLKAKCYKQVYH